jgi:hypothetical protein
MAAPLLLSCEKSSRAEATQAPAAETPAPGPLVALNSGGGDKEANKDADMKTVILHVFGMT